MKAKDIWNICWPLVLLLAAETLILFIDVDIQPYFFSLLLLYIVLSFLLHMVVHELGHLVFGLLTGYTFLSYRIFSWSIIKVNGRIVLKKQKQNAALGQALMVPNEKWDPENYPYQLYMSGGLIFNAAALVIAVVLYQLSVLPMIPVLIFSAIAVFFLLSNGVPRELNDGAVLKKGRQKKEYRKMMYHQLWTIYYLFNGKALNQLPLESFERSESIPLEDPYTVYVMRLSYYKELSEFRFDSAFEILEQQYEAVDKLTIYDKIMLKAEKLFCLSIQQRATEAKELFQDAEIQAFKDREFVTIKRVLAAYFLFVEVDSKKALTFVEEGLKLIQTDVLDPQIKTEEILLRWLEKNVSERKEGLLFNESKSDTILE